MLKKLENLDISPMNRDGNPGTPFIVLDDHYSRLQKTPLVYVYYNKNRWKDFIGIPNITGE